MFCCTHEGVGNGLTGQVFPPIVVCWYFFVTELFCYFTKMLYHDDAALQHDCAGLSYSISQTLKAGTFRLMTEGLLRKQHWNAASLYR